MALYVRDLAKVGGDDRDSAGSKAANLASLIAAGFPVPAGFCLVTTAFQRALLPFREQIALALEGRDLREPHQAAGAGRSIQHLLDYLALPGDVGDELDAMLAELGDSPLAVRSSAPVEDLAGGSLAGQYATILSVRGIEQVYAAVLTCWRSFYSARAIAARAATGLADSGGMAVLIQPMIEAECAGVCYSIDPVGMDRSLVVISAVWGAGAGVVDGSVPNDTYWLRRSTLQPERRHVVEKTEQIFASNGELQRLAVPAERRRAACLPETWAQRVGEAAVLAEQHFGTPQDVEWAIGEQHLWILQSRPLTGIPAHLRETDASPISWGNAADRRRRWVLVEACRERIPFPLENDYLDLLFIMAREDACRVLGADRMDDSMLVSGRRYLARRRGVLQPGDMRVRSQDTDHMNERLLQEHGLTGWDIWGPEIIARTKALHDVDLQAVSDVELALHLEDAMGAYRRHWMLHSPIMFPNARTYFRAYAALTGKREALIAEEAWSLARGERTVASELVDSLYALALEARAHPEVAALVCTPPSDVRRRLDAMDEAASFLVRLDAFLDRFGERTGTGRGSIGTVLTPTWQEDIETVLRLIAAYLDPAVPDPARVRERARAERDAEVERLCAACPDAATVAAFRRQLALARRLATVEETHNHYIDQLADGQLRLATLEVARRLASSGVIDTPDDVWWLHSGEILDSLRHSSGASRMGRIRRRRVDHARWERTAPPPVLGAPDVDLPPRPPLADEVEDAPSDDGIIKGTGGSRGRGHGPARLVAMGERIPHLRQGDVLVAVNAGPAWTAYFPVLAGVVLDEGSFAEHSVGIAREYGVPVVFGTRHASKRIAEGTWLTVDGTTGTVEPD